MAPMPNHSQRRAFVAVVVLATSIVLSIAVAQALADDGATAVPPLTPSSGEQTDCSSGGGSSEGYPDVSPADTADAFTHDFPCILDSLAADPPDPQADNAMTAGETPSGDAAADPLASVPPLRTTDESGEETPVDLSLQPAGDGYAPANPLVDLTLPADLGGEVAVGDRGIAVDMGATDPEAAQAASAEPLAGEGLFYADAAPATDVALAPISTGLETLYQLRSPDSPERLEMAFKLPDGASLEGSVDGGAQVVQGGQAVASVNPPLATDAAGAPVAATMTVNGDRLELDVPHSDPNVAYPIAVTATASSFVPAAVATATTVTPGMDGVDLLNGIGTGSQPAQTAQMGAKVVRYGMLWCSLEQSSGTYQKGGLQNVVDAVNNAHSKGMQVLVLLKTSAPPFARPTAMSGYGTPCTPGDTLGEASIATGTSNATSYGAAMKKIAWCLNADSRCNNNLQCSPACTVDMHGQMLNAGYVYGFEAGNEPNTQTFWDNGTNGNGTGTITQTQANIYYGALAQAVAQVHGYASSAGITINVSGAGLSYGSPNGNGWGNSAVDATTYLNQVLSNGNSGADAYSIHPYGPGLHPNMVYSNGVTVNADVIADAGVTRQSLINYGYGYTKPIWITEVGVDADYSTTSTEDIEEGRQFYDLYYTWNNSIRAVCSSYNVPLATFWTLHDAHKYTTGQRYYAGFAKIVGDPPTETVDYSKLAYYFFNSGQYFSANTCTG